MKTEKTELNLPGRAEIDSWYVMSVFINSHSPNKKRVFR